MAAPATTARSTPSGIRFPNGFSSKIAFNRDADFSFWERNVGTPGVDGGDPIDITTMHNTTWRTMVARDLMTLTPFTVTGAIDAGIYTDCINNLINQEGSITRHLPDGSKLDFFGFLQKIEFGEFVEGEMPTATITVVPTNFDPVNRTEQPPVLTSVTGT